MFFDHHIAFGCEADHRALDGFLAEGPDGGNVGQRRLQQLEADVSPTTLSERALPRHVGVHRVRDSPAFDHEVARTTERIRQTSEEEIRTAVTAATAPPEVADWLIEWRDELPMAIVKWRPILTNASVSK